MPTKMYSIAGKAKQNGLFMDSFNKTVETPEEAIEVFNQLQHLFSQNAFELRKRDK